jgi:hypothetical protein
MNTKINRTETPITGPTKKNGRGSRIGLNVGTRCTGAYDA